MAAVLQEKHRAELYKALNRYQYALYIKLPTIFTLLIRLLQQGYRETCFFMFKGEPWGPLRDDLYEGTVQLIVDIAY